MSIAPTLRERFEGGFRIISGDILGLESAPDKDSTRADDPKIILADLARKADIMHPMIKNDQIEQPAISQFRWIVMHLWWNRLVKDGGIEGLEYLQSAVASSRGQGEEGGKEKTLRFTLAHLSDHDHPIALYLMEKDGRGQGLGDELVWMAGVNMQRRWYIRRFMRGGHLIYGATPRDTELLNQLVGQGQELGFGDEESKKLEWVNEVFNVMNRGTRHKVTETCVTGKKPLAFYPEGGRAYDGFLQQAPHQFSFLLPRKDGIVVPARVYGGVELNPPGTKVKVLRKELLPYSKKTAVKMIVGEHYPSSEVWEIVSERQKEANRKFGTKAVKINPMDWVMANIANLDPQFVRPDDLYYYATLLHRFAPNRNRLRGVKLLDSIV